MDNQKKAKELIFSGDYTCVLVNGDKIITSTQRGVKPLLAWLDEKSDFREYHCADKVIGKAAAFLYVLLKVKSVYAMVISKPAIGVFERYGIDAEYGTAVEYIRNRTDTGYCPMEQAVLDVDTPKEAHKAIMLALEDIQKI